MRFGVRKPSLKKLITARTTGKAKRQLKKAIIPGYEKKGTGWIKDPKKQPIIKFTKKLLLVFVIYSNNTPSTTI